MANILTGSLNLNAKDKFSPASKFIQLVEYDPESSTMEITFQNGTKYKYFRVFPITYLSFKQSPTHDAYYSRAIKGQMMGTKIVDKGIGRKISAPLKQVKKEQPLNAGLRKQTVSVSRIRGTVDRAINAGGL